MSEAGADRAPVLEITFFCRGLEFPILDKQSIKMMFFALTLIASDRLPRKGMDKTGVITGNHEACFLLP